MENKQNKIGLRDLLITMILLLIIIATNTFFISLQLNKIRSKLENYPTKTEETQAYKQEIEVTPYDTITDLTGTTWLFNDIIDGKSFSDQYNINFISNEENYTLLYPSFIANQGGSVLYYGNTNNQVYGSGTWYNQAYRTIAITGGTDVTNSNLIEWLQEDGSLQNNTPTPTQLATPTLIKSSYNVLSWNAITNASNYAIYKNNVKIDTTQNTTYTINSLGSYEVKAIGDGTNYSDSELSNTINVVAENLATPQVSISSDFITWQGVNNASGYEIYKNNILVESIGVAGRFYQMNNTGAWQVKAVSNNVFFNNSDLSNAINFSIYNINYNLGNVVSTTEKPNEIYTGQSITINFRAYNNYNLPEYINVIGATYSWNEETGNLTISNAINSVYIEIMAEYKSGQYTMVELLDSVILVPVNTFYNMFNFELLGVNLYALLLGALTLFLIIKIYLKVFK